MFFIRTSAILPGDFLILDNCRIHFSHQIRPLLLSILNALDIKLIFLPAYSPELSPCETVFSQVKSFVNNRVRRPNENIAQFFENILQGFARVSRQQLLKYYDFCLFGRQGA